MIFYLATGGPLAGGHLWVFWEPFVPREPGAAG